jgi:hypothetical protein
MKKITQEDIQVRNLWIIVLAILLIIVSIIALFLLNKPRVIYDDELGYIRGLDRGVTICEDNYKPMLAQYVPTENCMILIEDKYLMKYICKGDKFYSELNK